MRPENPAANCLFQWNYSRDEWRKFQRWYKRKQGWWSYLLHLMGGFHRKPVPEVLITPDRVYIGDVPHSFQSPGRQLRKVDIRSEGEMNVMEISFDEKGTGRPGSGEIRVLVPKGRLKEAISLQEQLERG